MNVTELITDDSAVSPVIGVVLMVAITVLLAATAGSFFLGLTDSTGETPQAAITFDYQADADHEDDVLVITHDGGDELDASNIDVVIEAAGNSGSVGVINERYTWKELSTGSPSSLSAGSQVNVSIETLDKQGVYSGVTSGNEKLALDSGSVEVVWNPDNRDQTFTLNSWSR